MLYHIIKECNVFNSVSKINIFLRRAGQFVTPLPNWVNFVTNIFHIFKFQWLFQQHEAVIVQILIIDGQNKDENIHMQQSTKKYRSTNGQSEI